MKIKNLLISMRFEQWIKNLFVFAALIFSKNLLSLHRFLVVSLVFLVFCLLSSSVYLLNDLLDLEKDRYHPQKKNRPLAAGLLPVSTAIFSVIFLSALGLAIAFLLGTSVGIIVSIYFILMIFYNFYLQNLIILDVLTIAFGFVLRVICGAVAINVEFSSWLLICTILLALFLALAKRRHELIILGEDAEKHRPILRKYTAQLLDEMIAVVTASSFMSYSLYTIWPETVKKFQTKNLIFTIPFILYGIFRYLYLIHQKQLGGNPEKIILQDYPLLINILLWIVSVIIIIYS